MDLKLMNIESKELFINIKMKKNEKKKHLSTKYIYGFNFHHSAISKSMHIMFLKSEKKKSLKSTLVNFLLDFKNVIIELYNNKLL